MRVTLNEERISTFTCTRQRDVSCRNWDRTDAFCCREWSRNTCVRMRLYFQYRSTALWNSDVQWIDVLRMDTL